MALPSRVFVGVIVFGLIAQLTLAAYAFLLMTGYAPPPQAPHEMFFPAQGTAGGGEVVFVVVANLFTLLLVVGAWRALLHGARRDARQREDATKLRRELLEYQRRKQEQEKVRGQQRPPPGYT